MPRSPLPYLSPYLRPALLSAQTASCPKEGSAGARLVFDNEVGGGTETLSPLEERIVRALWPPVPDAERALDALAGEVGEAVLDEALATLTTRKILFDSAEQCEAALDREVSTMVPELPFVDQVEITTHCPMRCGFCPRGIEGRMRRPRSHMPFALFARLLEQMSPVQARYRPLELDCLGEPLVHPEVDRFVEAATLRGLPTELSVNPSLLTPKLAEKLLRAGLTRLVISLDATDEQTLTALRGPAASYARAERNLRELLTLARARPTPPSIVIQMIALERNQHMRDEFLSTWGNTGEPFVQAYIKPLDGPDPDTGKPSAHPVRYLCKYPFVSVSVLCDGSVVPCCRDAQGDYVLGNLQEESLASIWYGERARALRHAYLRDELAGHVLCGPCPWERGTFRRTVAERHPDHAVLEPLHG